MDQDYIKVQAFDLSKLDEKSEYERLRNTYEMVKEEFSYAKDKSPLVTLWYAVKKDA